jgi:Uma2 family endonuclease
MRYVRAIAAASECRSISGNERAAEFRSEYYNGRMYAMAGGSLRQAPIIANLVRRLGNAFDGSPCRVVSSDLRVQVSPDGLHTYPDVVVVCGPPELRDSHKDTLLSPTLVIEILSPSTEAYDRGFKSAQYRTLKSLKEYALVSQSEPRVELFRRHSGNDWLLTDSIGLQSACRFDSVGCEIPLAQVYDQVSFDETGV